ncbi:MAG: hypothetical protein H5T73_05795 [Actinobacteria bacterium]|nr:hypothetical protein [Actinomycetota bacterium]
MRIAFPHMGNAFIPLRALVESLGAEAVVPERPNAETLKRGLQHSPEFVCLPFKVTLGDCLSALDRGADTLAMVCGMWACRFGNYGRVQHMILKDLGYEFDSVLIGRENAAEVAEKFRTRLGPGIFRRLPGALAIFKSKAVAVDELERLARWARPRGEKPGDTDALLSRYLKRLDEADSLRAVRELSERFREELFSLPLDGDGGVTRVRLVGELYVLLEPSLSCDLVRRLGSRFRVEVHPVLSTYRWLLGPLWLDPRIQLGAWLARRRTRPYLPYVLGGEEHMTVSGILDAPRQGFEGVIHAYPLTCMPENICRTVMPAILSRSRLPYLELCFDEHTSPAGVDTRLEAFVDLVRSRILRAAS